jgi:hypothetical protein
VRIVRIALPLLVVVAVAVPTALIAEPGYSNQQVVRAFKAEGLSLHLTGSDRSRNENPRGPWESEYIFRSRDHKVSVIVFHPVRRRVRFDPPSSPGGTGPTPETVWARNVVASWIPYTLSFPGEDTRVRAALARLDEFPAR